MNALPVAAASYVVARLMGGNATIASNMIAATSILSTIRCPLRIVALISIGGM